MTPSQYGLGPSWMGHQGLSQFGATGPSLIPQTERAGPSCPPPLSSPSPPSSPPRPRQNPSERTYIDIDGVGNFINGHVIKTIVSILKENFAGPWKSFKKFPDHVKKALWKEFKATYRWPTRLGDERVRRLFEKKIGDRLKQMLHIARNEANKKGNHDMRGHPPDWISEEIWDKLCDKWYARQRQKQSSTNHKNRGTEEDGRMTKHIVASITFSSHERRLAKKLGRPATHTEVFRHCHTRRSGDKAGEFVDDKSKKVVDIYEEEVHRKYGQNGPPNFDLDVWNKVVGNSSRNRVYGLTQSMGASQWGRSHEDAEFSQSREVDPEIRKLQTDMATLN